MTIGKKVGKLADKMLSITKTAAQKLEDYAAKSAEENDNENARKLSATMNKLSEKIDSNKEEYIASVEKNADELAEKGKIALNKLKDVLDEMKTRADVAKEKAENDVQNDISAQETPSEKPKKCCKSKKNKSE